MAHAATFINHRPAAAKREATQCDDHPDEVGTIRHGTAIANSQKTQACPKARQNRSRHRYADPRRAEGHCTGARLALFSLDRARPVSLLARQKRNGGCIPLDQPPAGAETLWPPSGGPYHLNPSGRCVPTGNPQTPQSSLPRQSSRAHRDNALRFHNIDMPAGLSPGIPPFLAVFFFRLLRSSFSRRAKNSINPFDMNMRFIYYHFMNLIFINGDDKL